MKSKLARESRKALLEANQRLTPEQRVQASVAQSRVIAQLQEAGRRLRERSIPPPAPRRDESLKAKRHR